MDHQVAAKMDLIKMAMDTMAIIRMERVLSTLRMVDIEMVFLHRLLQKNEDQHGGEMIVQIQDYLLGHLQLIIHLMKVVSAEKMAIDPVQESLIVIHREEDCFHLVM